MNGGHQPPTDTKETTMTDAINWAEGITDPFAEPAQAPETTNTEAPAEAQAPEPSLKDTLTLIALRRILADEIYAQIKEDERAVFKRLVHEYHESGSTGWDVNVDDTHGERHRIGKASLTIGKPQVVAEDEKALIEYMKKVAPDLVETIEHPAREAYTEERLTPEAGKFLAKQTVGDKDDETGTRDLVDETGEIIPGAAYREASDPTKFSITWGGAGSPGKRLAHELLMNGEVAGTSVLELTGYGETEQDTTTA